ncbi:MAG: xanthine dehydrogenase family protein subunit M [Gemmatales bacterium]|nr:xanthine dehydrogenase family protein subunit M [Gemmatales bacterium]MDW7993722.1 xanthine dehydrogenase family protein subunit M [Gemmatales bacterium]
MKNFTYYRPLSLEAAVALLDTRWGTTELLAGGTDLLDLQKEYIAQPDKVVSLTFIQDPVFTRIEVPQILPGTKPTVSIGAAVKIADIAEHAELKHLFPALTDAAAQVGGPQIRNMGTLGGNLCQRNRCWYFRDEHVLCLLKGGRRCFAADGENRYHAIFTKGHPCVIVHPSTLAPALIALGASVEVLGPNGKRTIELSKFFQAPTKPDQREHVLAPNEIVVRVLIPVEGLRNASYEVRHKQSYDWPLAQAAVAFRLIGGKATDVRIVLGHVAPTPHVATEAQKVVEGQTITRELAEKAGEAATAGAVPLSQNAYKVHLVKVAVKRALLLASGAQPDWVI